MGRALPLVLLVALTVFALVDAIQTPRDQVSRKGWWLLGILLLPVVGPVAWLTVGRSSRRAPGQPGGRSGGPPIAPDDDPDFLHGL